MLNSQLFHCMPNVDVALRRGFRGMRGKTVIDKLCLFIKPNSCYCNTMCIYVIWISMGVQVLTTAWLLHNIVWRFAPQLSPSMIFHLLGGQIREMVVAARLRLLLLFAIYPLPLDHHCVSHQHLDKLLNHTKLSSWPQLTLKCIFIALLCNCWW